MCEAVGELYAELRRPKVFAFSSMVTDTVKRRVIQVLGHAPALVLQAKRETIACAARQDFVIVERETQTQISQQPGEKGEKGDHDGEHLKLSHKLKSAKELIKRWYNDPANSGNTMVVFAKAES